MGLKPQKNPSKSGGKTAWKTGPIVHHKKDSKWYEYGDKTKSNKCASISDVQMLEQRAQELLRKDVELYAQVQMARNASEENWLNIVLNQGTASDKISALQILLDRSPVHSLNHLESLVELAANKNIRQAFTVMGTIKDLFINDLLPTDRKLISFAWRPLDNLSGQTFENDQKMKKCMILWKFESDLKKLYEKFVDALERLSNGNVEKLCSSACHIALQLLVERPEQEQKLLSFLVNKLGHPNKTSASKASNFLLKLIMKQPSMRDVIVNEVERLIYRKNVTRNAQMHAVSFLSQLDLRTCKSSTAATLLNIYIGLFRLIISKEPIDEKMLTTLLVAANRALPFAKGEINKLMSEIDTLYKIVHKTNTAASLQTLKLLYQLYTISEGASDRFYSALYRQLLVFHNSPSIYGQLFGLLQKVMKNDYANSRVTAFIKRLLQLSLYKSAPFAAASLLLVSGLVKERPSLLITKRGVNKHAALDIVKIEESSINDDDEVFHDVPDESNVKLESSENDSKVNVQKTSAGWVHKDNIVIRKANVSYNSEARNPLFASAEFCVASELLLLSSHYHPSVAVFASNLLHGIAVNYNGDPLMDFSAMRFFDRFVFRNPKTVDKKQEKGIIRRKAYNPKGVKKIAVTCDEYASMKPNEIPVDERFLHRYISKQMQIKKAENVNDSDNDDIESVNSDEFESLLSRFEPGEKRELFDVDFTREFGSEKSASHKKQSKRRNVDTLESDEETDESETEDANMDADEFSDEGEDDDVDDNELDDNSDIDSNFDDGDAEASDSSNMEYNMDEETDEEMDEGVDYAGDAAISADKFAMMMEEDEEEVSTKGKRKTKKFKRRRKT